MKKNNIFVLIVLIFITISINAVSANEADYIVPINSHSTANPALSFDITDPNEIFDITERNDFRTWALNKGISPSNCIFEIVSPDSSVDNLIEVRNTTHKWFYSVKNNIIESEGNPVSFEGKFALNSNANHFKIINRCGKTVHLILVAYYRLVGAIPVQFANSYRYNIKNGGVLNYNPSPEFTHVSIAIDVDDLGWWRTHSDIYKLAIPLKSWHTGTIRKGNGYYLDFS